MMYDVNIKITSREYNNNNDIDGSLCVFVSKHWNWHDFFHLHGLYTRIKHKYVATLVVKQSKQKIRKSK